MPDELRSGIKRLARLVEVRHTYCTVAEAVYREAEAEVNRLVQLDAECLRQIQAAQAEIAESKRFTGAEAKALEQYIGALGLKRIRLQQSIEKARSFTEQKRLEWIETMRDERVIEKVRDRRLQEWEREDEILKQKSMDDAFIGRLVRSRLER